MIENFINKITLGDCLEVMKQLPDKCIDLILTDPPYGIKANSMQMGRNGYKLPRSDNEWDSEIPKDETVLWIVSPTGNSHGLRSTNRRSVINIRISEILTATQKPGIKFTRRKNR